MPGFGLIYGSAGVRYRILCRALQDLAPFACIWNSSVIIGGLKVMMRVRLQDIALATLLVAIPLTGCAPQDQC